MNMALKVVCETTLQLYFHVTEHAQGCGFLLMLLSFGVIPFDVFE